MSAATKWAPLLRRGGMPAPALQAWESLQAAIAGHQKLLSEHGIGREVSERDRVRVNARRVGLEAPQFADEAADSFANILNHALSPRDATAHRATQQPQQKLQQQESVSAGVASAPGSAEANVGAL